MTDRSFALLGSGEFEPWQEEVDRWLAERSSRKDGPVLILPTAAAHEGDESFDFWANKGIEHYRSIGRPAEVLPLKTSDDASRDEIVSRLRDASAVFFSGGNPKELAAKLRGTLFWSELLRGMKAGLPYAGCSAGVACLGPFAPDSDAATIDETVLAHPGLDLFRDVQFMPHWDELDQFAPGLTDLVVGWTPPGWQIFAIETTTAAVGDGAEWTVMGSGKVHVYADGDWEHFAAPASFPWPLLPGTAWG
jgi:cyanophycinase